MSFLETIAALVAFVVIVGISLIPLEFVAKIEERYHERKHKQRNG